MVGSSFCEVIFIKLFAVVNRLQKQNKCVNIYINVNNILGEKKEKQPTFVKCPIIVLLQLFYFVWNVQTN